VLIETAENLLTKVSQSYRRNIVISHRLWRDEFIF